LWYRLERCAGTDSSATVVPIRRYYHPEDIRDIGKCLTYLHERQEEKAAMLLYLVVKNHSFSDGNKRIAAMLFLWFMENNGILYSAEGRKRIADNTLVALTLMIAESRTEEKDVMVKVVVNLINKDNQ
ncbi:MAG: Fic family protein, partial [Parabacteroides sp.]|nr:Fic family protein [Parabacteroides sp.]